MRYSEREDAIYIRHIYNKLNTKDSKLNLGVSNEGYLCGFSGDPINLKKK